MSDIVKTCTKHGGLTEAEIKKGIYKGKKYRKCRHCELERSREYHKKLYADSDRVKQKHATDKKRWETKKEEITAKRKEPKALAKRRDTYAKNPEKYRKACNLKQKIYRETLDDAYMRKIIQNGDKRINFGDISKGMIDLKRSLMKLKRGIKQVQTENIWDELNEDQKYRNVT